MNVYLVSSKLTYSRALVVARNEDEAKLTRPDGASWRHGQWYAPTNMGHGWHASIEMKPSSVPWWPDSLDDVEVNLFGRTVEMYSDTGVWFYEASEAPR